MDRNKRAYRRLRAVTILVTVLTAVLAGVLPSFAYTTATGGWANWPNDGKYRGISIEGGSSWEGSYAVKPAGMGSFLVVYCASPHKEGPSTAGGYGGIQRQTNPRLDTGATMSHAQAAQVAYLLWAHGSSGDARTAAAVSAATWSLEGYGDYNLYNPSSHGSQDANQAGVRSLALSYMAEAQRYAGSYKLKVWTVPAKPVVGQPVTIDAQLVAASGAAVPGISIDLTLNGQTHTVTSNSAGTASSSFKAPAAVVFDVNAAASNVAPDTLSLAYPNNGGAQTVFVAGDSAHIYNSLQIAPKPKGTPVVTTTASTATAGVGVPLHDNVTVSSLDAGYTGTATATLYGPFPAQPTQTSCTSATAVGHVTFVVNHEGTYTTPSITPTQGAGYYVWVESLPANAVTNTTAVTSPCGVAQETTLAQKQPQLVTQASAQLVYAGATLHDTVNVSGLGNGANASTIGITWTLFGPMAPNTNHSCTGVSFAGAPAADTGSLTATGDGQVTTGTTTVTKVGCYSYEETAPATSSTLPATSERGQTAETALVDKHQPVFATTASQQVVSIGASVHDSIAVTGTAGATVPIQWTLLGPLAPAADGTCTGLNWTGAPTIDSGTVTATGDGTVQTPDVKLTSAGCVTFVETSPEGATVWAATSPAGQTAETVLVDKYHPQAVTQASAQMVNIGGTLHDTIAISGLPATGTTPITVAWSLMGPVAPAADGTCTGVDFTNAKAYAQGTVDATTNGNVTTADTKVTQIGCYSYDETIAATATTWPAISPVGQPAETALVDVYHPKFVTQASAQQAQVGDQVSDAIAVTGTGGAQLNINWTLLGPVAATSTGSCSGVSFTGAATAGQGTVTANGDGTVNTPKTTLNAEGCYSYVETAAATSTTAPVDSPVGQGAETVYVAKNLPHFVTQASANKVGIGSTLTDKVQVSNSNGQPLTVTWVLAGPVAPAADGTCSNRDWTNAPIFDQGSFTTTGDGDYTTSVSKPVQKLGCYTYTESSPATGGASAVTTMPGVPAETVVVAPHQPVFVTHVPAQHVLIGGTVHDTINVTGLVAGDKVDIAWTLLGPIAPQGLSCNGLVWTKAPVAAHGVVTATGNGNIVTPSVKLNKVGCYTYEENAAATKTTVPATSAPGQPVETVLVTRTPIPNVPEVPTGGFNNGLPKMLGGTGPDALAGIEGGLLVGLGGVAFMIWRRRRTAE
jgi:hypothetical protein